MPLAAETLKGEAMSVTLMIVEINGISESRGHARSPRY